MSLWLTAAIAALSISIVPAASAEDAFHPSRVRLVIHGGHDFSDNVRLDIRFVPAGNLMNGIAPLTYVGAKVHVTDWLDLEGYTGLVFATDEPLFSFSTNPHSGRLWAWTEIDLWAVTHGGYWFAQGEYKRNDWLHLGIEGEGWGNWEDGDTWSHGGGPNMLWRFDKFGTDIAVHMRDLNREVKPELFLRFHLFL